MPSIGILLILTTLLCIAQSQSQNSPPARLRSDLVEDGVLVGPGSLRFSTSVEDSNSLRPRFKLFRSSIDIDDEVKEEETTPDFLSGTEVNQEPAVEEEEGVPKSKQKFKLFRFVSDDEDDSPDFLSENLQPAATITRTESLPIPRNLETVAFTLEDVENDESSENSINIFGSTNFPEGADDTKETLSVGNTELESSSVPALDEFENEDMTELESNDGTNTSRDEDEEEAEDSVEEETESLLSLSGMMKLVSSLMSSNEVVKGVKKETETPREGERGRSTSTLKPDINPTPSTSSVEVNPQIQSSQESTSLLNDGDEVQKEYQDDEQIKEANQDPISIIESAQTDGESTPDDLMEMEVDKMMEDMLPGPANSHEDMESGSSEIIGRDQLGSKFKPLVIKVLGSFKSSNLSLNGKVEKLRSVLISESPAIIRYGANRSFLLSTSTFL